MRLEFTKMQGCGNDYIYIDCRAAGLPAQAGEWARRLSPRHLSVGADGVICICAPQNPSSHAAMRMFNADGSEGRMCGNGVRCVAEYLYRHGCAESRLYIDTPLDTASPTKTLERVSDGVWSVSMGRYRLTAADIPAVDLPDGPLIDVPLQAAGQTWRVCCVNVGNPHCVTLTDVPLDTLDLAHIGPCFETHPCFPERVNAEFVRVTGPDALEMRVWERGSGETLACGTGACAAAAACVELGLCRRDAEISVTLRGGRLHIRVTAAGGLVMTGPAETVYTGQVEV